MSEFDELVYKKQPTSIHVPDFAFDPRDSWTLAFQNGLRQLNANGKIVYEVGVGTGNNIVFLLSQCNARQVYGSDLDERLTEIAYETVSTCLPSKASQFHALRGSVNLLGTPEAAAAANVSDFIVACIPQAVDLEDPIVETFIQTYFPDAQGKVKQPDHHAHYYPFAAFQQYHYNRFGLGLNEALLDSARKNAPHAILLLNLSGRIGLPRLLEMITKHQYTPTVVYQTIVPQCGKTSIAYYAALEACLEREGIALESEFYFDVNGKERITARQAEELRASYPDAPLFHSLYVIEATPQNGQQQVGN